MIQEADRLAFPLIELPPPTSFNDVIAAVLGVILDVQSTQLLRAAEIHERFMSIVLSGGGLRQIAEALAEAIAMPIAIVDPSGATLAQSPDFDPAQSDVPADAIRQAIRAGGEDHGTIVVLGRRDRLGDDELESLDYAATIAALRLVQARAVAEADRRFQAVCLEELVTGHVADRAALMERAAAFGWDLSTPHSVLVAEIQQLRERPFGRLAGSADESAARHRLVDAARLTLGQRAIVWERTAGIAALLPATRSRGAARQSGTELLAEAARRLPDAVVDVGVGTPTDDPLTLDASFREARTSIAVAGWSRGHGMVSLFEELALDRLLFNAPPADRAGFIEGTIGALVAYDERHRTSLVETLDVYLTTRNVADAARRLYVHYNTLANRLERIATIVGPFVDDADRCLTLGLALRLRRSPAS
jgi:purine catabolism regulator